MRIEPHLEQIWERLAQADGQPALERACADLRDHYGILHVAYHWVDTAGAQYGCGTYGPLWSERYQNRNYLRIDPVVSGCYRRFEPVDWKDLDWSSRAARKFRRDALDHGVGDQGFSVPIRGPHGQFALFTTNQSCTDAVWAAFTARHRRDLIWAAHCFNEKALALAPDRAPGAVQALSPREVDAMTLLAVGYSRAQVAERLSISEHTLRAYVESARFKLGASNTTHAVARALSRGLIFV